MIHERGEHFIIFSWYELLRKRILIGIDGQVLKLTYRIQQLYTLGSKMLKGKQVKEFSD